MEKAKILIVEDEAIIAMEIESQLQSLGYEVTSIVDTGEKAIEKAEVDKPDLILMDIRIKGEMDGIDTAEEIRNRFGIPVIFSTAYLDENRIERAKITMPFGYVLKPIQERDLRVTIEMALYVSRGDVERRKVETSLFESEQKYRSLFEKMINGFALLEMIYSDDGKTIDCRYLDANPAHEKLTGLKSKDIIGKTARECIDNLEDAWIENYEQVEKTGEPMQIENYVDGLKSWYKVFAYRPKSGLVAVVFENITERKQAEEALKESEEKFRTVITNSQAVTFILDENGVFILSEGKGLKLLGLKPGQVVGQSAFDVYKEYPKVISGLKKAMKGDTIRDILDVGEVTFDTLYTPIEGKPGYVAGIATDITERVKSEKALKESVKKNHDLYENAPDMFASICAKTGKVLKCNKTTMVTLGYTQEEILNTPVFDLYSKDSSEYARKEVFPEFLKNGYIEGEKLDLQKKNGEKITVLLKASAVRDLKGCIVESRSVWRDITKQERTEIALQKTLHHLENLVEVRTIDLKNANEKLKKEINKSEEITDELKKSKIRYRTIADFTYDWETWIDPVGNNIYVSPSCERISGYRPEEFIKDPNLIIKITHADDRDKVMYHFKNTEHSKRFTLPIDFRITNRKGELVWISHACRSVHNSANNYLGRRGSNRDITERKQVEEKLTKSEERFRTLFENIQDGFALHELVYDDNQKPINYKFLEINPSFERITRLKKEDIVGKKVTEALPGIENDPADWIGTYGKVVINNEPISFEQFSENLNNWFSCRAFKTEENCFAVSFTEITDRKKAES